MSRWARLPALALSAALVGAAAVPAWAETVALAGGRVVTLDGRPPLEPGTVVIRDGRIERVGGGPPPAGARVVDVRGMTVTPGLCAADTHIGLTEIDQEATTRDFAVLGLPGGEPNHAAFRVADAVNPRSTLVAVARGEGVTSTVTTPDGGLVSGQSAWLDLTAPDPDRMIRSRALGVHALLGPEGAKAAGGSRGFALTRLREMLDDARTWLANRAAFDRNQSRRLAGTRLDLEALARVVRGELPLVVHADREADLLGALELARAERIRLVIVGGAEAWRVADRLAAAHTPVLVDPVDNLPQSFDLASSRLDNAALLARAGVLVGIALRGESHGAGTLRQLAGIAAAYGLPHDEALEAASRNVARAFGMDRDYGTLAPGKVANVVVWTGDPLELSTRAAHVFVQGEELRLESRQTRLRERYRALPLR
jgi:imidazolonepropionase-like amidohydrolase